MVTSTMNLLWSLLFAAIVAAAPGNKLSQRPSGCQILASKFTKQVSYPGSERFKNETEDYWSKSVILQPHCVFVPRNANDIAAALPILRSANTKFAVRGNGHMTVKRAASIDNGVLIVLTELRQLTIASDHEIASLGPGITWIDVYDWVQKFNRTIVGGRYAPVGVSGLLLGGGISFHSGQYGWAANSVLNFEVVTSDGKVIYANRTSHSDLFWALKGGGSNFGIVTRFDVKTHPSGLIHGGLVSFEPSNVGHAFKALESFSEPGGGVDNPKAALLPNIFIDPASGNQSAGIFGFVDSADGSALNNFTENSSVSTVKLRTYADFIAEGAGSGAPGSFRGAFHCASFKASAQTVKLINDTVTPSAIRNMKAVPGSVVALSIQPIGRNMFTAARKSGGDAIDIDPAKGNIIILNLVVQWARAEDDGKVTNWANSILAELQKRAKYIGLEYSFIYMNEAQEGTQPFLHYGGGKSRAKMLEVRRKYDRHGLFQSLMPGGFKLGK